MKKANIGLSVGFVAALSYLLAYFIGFTPLILLVGCVLLKEKNDWLRFVCVKALVLSLLFTVVSSVLYLLPNFFGVINSFCRIFEGSGIRTPVLDHIFDALKSCLDFAEKILFILLALFALKRKTITLPLVDNWCTRIVATVDEMQQNREGV